MINQGLPEITLKLAISLDGYLDNDSEDRLILSSAEDLIAVDRLRAESDGILVGANTIRKDNPNLTIKDLTLVMLRQKAGKSPHPSRIIISESGELSANTRIFSGESTTLIYSNKFHPEFTITNVKVYPLPNSLTDLLIDLKTKGISKLLVEGGANLINQLITAGLFNFIRIAIAPITLGPQAKSTPRFNITKLLHLKEIKQEQLGDTNVLWFQK